MKRYQFRNYDFKLVLLMCAITVIGILTIGSAKETVQDKQILGFLMGLFLMVMLSFFDYHFFLQFHWLIYIVNIGLLLLVTIDGLGVNRNGSQRWVEIASIQFQPSETAKIMLILFYAKLIMDKREKINNWKTILFFLILLAPPLLLIVNQPDLSTTIMVTIVFCVILFVGGLSFKVVGGIVAIVVPAFLIFMFLVVQPDQSLLEDYQQTRILAWLEPEEHVDIAYQQVNAKIAIGSGQLFGKGLNNNVVGSVKNGNFIAEPQTDFIFAIIGEELGFIGGCTVIVLLLLITIECLAIARRACDLAGTLIASGMAGLVGFQSIMNLGVATALLPNTGIPLPFVSYGLTSLVSLYIGMGFVLNVRLQSTKMKNR